MPRSQLPAVALAAAIALGALTALPADADPVPEPEPFDRLLAAIHALDEAAGRLSQLLWDRRSIPGLLMVTDRVVNPQYEIARAALAELQAAEAATRDDLAAGRVPDPVRPGESPALTAERLATELSGLLLSGNLPPDLLDRGPELSLAIRKTMLARQLELALEQVWAEARTGALTPDDAAAAAALGAAPPAPGRLTAAVDRDDFLRRHSPVTGPAQWARLELWEAAILSAVVHLRRRLDEAEPGSALESALRELAASNGPEQAAAAVRARLGLQRVQAELPPEEAGPLVAAATAIIGEVPPPEIDPLLAGQGRPGAAGLAVKARPPEGGGGQGGSAAPALRNGTTPKAGTVPPPPSGPPVPAPPSGPPVPAPPSGPPVPAPPLGPPVPAPPLGPRPPVPPSASPVAAPVGGDGLFQVDGVKAAPQVAPSSQAEAVGQAPPVAADGLFRVDVITRADPGGFPDKLGSVSDPNPLGAGLTAVPAFTGPMIAVEGP